MALKIAKDLSLPNDAVTQTFAALGRRGSGKTNTAVVMAEEMLRAGDVIVWLDPLGVAWGLRSEFSILIAGGERGDIPLEPTGGKVMAEFLVENRVSCILDVSLFGENEMRRFVGEFAATFYRLNREPVHLFVDEADEFAPQSGMNAEGAKCLGAMQNIVRRGRARGIGCTLITQRSAVLNKSVLTQTECLFALQTTAPHDLHAIEDWLKYHGTPEECKAILRELPKLQQGECWVYSPAWLQMLKRVKIRARDTHDSSRTPKPGERKTEPKTLAQVDLAGLKGQMAATVEKAKANDPKLLQARIRQLEAAAKSQPAAAPDQGAIDRAVAKAVKERDQHWQGEVAKLTRDLKDRNGRLQKIEQFAHLNGEATITVSQPPSPAINVSQKVERVLPVRPAPRPKAVAAAPVDGLSKKQQQIIDAVAWWESIGEHEPRNEQVGAIALIDTSGGYFSNCIGPLVTGGLVERGNGSVRLTDAGRAAARPLENVASLADYHEMLRDRVRRSRNANGKTLAILDAMIDAGGEELSNEQIGETVEIDTSGGYFSNSIGPLSTIGLIERRSGIVRPTDLLFPPGID